MNKIKVASSQFSLERLGAPDEFWARVEFLMKEAATQGALFMQFPEYFALSWLLAHHKHNFSTALDGFSHLAEEFHGQFERMARQYKLAVLAGSVPFVLNDRLVNRAFVYLPSGERFYQDKCNMTRFESEEWNVTAGHDDVLAFAWQGIRWGVAICYDVEFPEYVRRLVQKDIDVLLVPSCTDDVHGYWRVRHCAEARAVESQSYVVMSSIVGGDMRHSEINEHYGAAGFFTPCDKEFPPGGVLALGDVNKENVHVVELDLEKLKRVRIHGTVLNRRDQG